MTRHASDAELLDLHWDGSPKTGSHVAECSACAARLEELREVLRASASLPVPERGPEYGREVWARLAPRLPDRPEPAAGRLLDLFRPRALVFAGSLAAVAVAAYLAGRLGAPTPPPPAAAPAAVAVASDRAAAERVLYAELASHLDRSEAVLLELVHGSAGGDVASEQERLADLLPDNRLYRQSARRSGEPAVSSLLEEIERVLLEVEHGPARLTEPEREDLRRRIEADGLLFRLRILSARVRRLEGPRGNPAPAAPAALPTPDERKRA
jgi:hypothetical protein